MTRVKIKTDSKTVTEAVTARLREEIEGGQFDPGQRLIQANIAAAYGVSTTPVRESFVKLEHEGLLVNSAHRGVVVFKPSVKDLNELYEMRVPLESLATELAVPHLTDEDLETLKECLAGMKRAGEAADVEQRGILNEQFHMTIYEAADRARLLRTIEGLRASSRAYLRRFRAVTRTDAVRVEEEHQAIYDACAARSPQDAVAVMESHLRHTVDVVAEELRGN